MGQDGAGAPYVAADRAGRAHSGWQCRGARPCSSLPDAQVLADLDAVADYGKKLPSADGKLYVAGFCWGGGKTFLFATHRGDLSGGLRVLRTTTAGRRDEEHHRSGVWILCRQRCAYLRDDTTNRRRYEGCRQGLEPVTYDGAGHGFMRAGEAPDADAADTTARAEGFRRLVMLLGGVR